MTGVFTSVYFRVGLFFALLLLIGLKFWWSRRRYLREEAERAEQRYSTRGARSSIIFVIESDSQQIQLHQANYPPGRNQSPLPPPEFDDAIKFCEKVNVDDDVLEDEPPPSYHDYVKSTISASGASVGNVDIESIPSVVQHGSSSPKMSHKKSTTQNVSSSTLPDVENHL